MSRQLSEWIEAPPRGPADWVEDMTWHRRMFRQSYFRWRPDDAMSIALRRTRGRLIFNTPGDVRRLADVVEDLQNHSAGIDAAMVPRLKEARQQCTPQDWRAGLELVGLTQRDVDVLVYSAMGEPTQPQAEIRRALRGIPLPNPFSQVWELRQLRSMYSAAENLLEDAFADLVLELGPRQGWGYLAQLMPMHHTALSLQQRVDDQRRERGEPGDPRRQPEQRY